MTSPDFNFDPGPKSVFNTCNRSDPNFYSNSNSYPDMSSTSSFELDLDTGDRSDFEDNPNSEMIHDYNVASPQP